MHALYLSNLSLEYLWLQGWKFTRFLYSEVPYEEITPQKWDRGEQISYAPLPLNPDETIP